VFFKHLKLLEQVKQQELNQQRRKEWALEGRTKNNPKKGSLPLPFRLLA
jgi:hypothetical protein